MKLVRRLGTISAIAMLTMSAHSQDRAPAKEMDFREESMVICADGLTGGDCELARGIVRLAMKRLSISIPEWRIVVVPEGRWQKAADRFRVKSTTPAFSSLGIRTTYVDGRLLSSEDRIDENLQRYTSLKGISKLTWIIAHEYGHILCQTADERVANAAAGRLMYGRGQACR